MNVAQLRAALAEFEDDADVELVVNDQWSNEIEDSVGRVALDIPPFIQSNGIRNGGSVAIRGKGTDR